MKKTLILAGILTFILACSLDNANAGTVLAGAKYWSASWDSAVIDWFEKDIGVGFRAVGANLVSDVDKGSGYLAGPVIGYQNDAGTWAFSLALMAFSDFNQDWHGTAETMTLATSIDTRRTDIDLAATYSLSGYKDSLPFLKYCRVFAGYKYQTLHYDMILNYLTQMGTISYPYDLEAEVNMPTLGFGFVYPLRPKIALGLQGGTGLALIDLKMKDPQGVTFTIDPKYSFTFNAEASLNLLPIDRLIVQLGLRYQEWYLKARSPQRWARTESKDITFGPTVTVVYAF